MATQKKSVPQQAAIELLYIEKLEVSKRIIEPLSARDVQAAIKELEQLESQLEYLTKADFTNL